MKLSLKQIIVLSWCWYFIKILFWLAVAGFFIYGVILLSHDKPNSDTGASMGFACLWVLFCLMAAFQQSFTYPKKSVRYDRDWSAWPNRNKQIKVTNWENLINGRS